MTGESVQSGGQGIEIAKTCMEARMSGRGPQKLWSNYRDFSAQRGELVADILEKHLPLAGATLLDAGCGSGAIATALARRSARVIAVDIAGEQPSDETIHWRRQPVETLELNGVCDAVILWDVLEHLGDPAAGVMALARALKPGGLLLLATPNRLSWINALGDPHYGLPLLALLRRAQVRRIVAGWLKWHRPDKPDFPELLSLSRIAQILATAGFDWRFIQRQVYDAALQNPHGVWNRNWHLRLMKGIIKINLDRPLRRMVSDRSGWMNRFTMPTFFILARKR